MMVSMGAGSEGSEAVRGGQDPEFVKGAFARIADRYVLTNHVLSCGTDILWRRRVGRRIRGWNPSRILDVATGTGDLALELQRRCPAAQVVGTDFCEEMLGHARTRGLKETMVADALGQHRPHGSGHSTCAGSATPWATCVEDVVACWQHPSGSPSR